MVLVAVKVEASPETDTEARQFGIAIDQTLNTDFWTSQPEKVIKNPDGTPFLSNKAFFKTFIFDLTEGTHTIRFAPSSPSGYTWKAKIVINRINSLGEQTGLTVFNQYNASFDVKTRTHKEIRKAIAEADRYLDRLYQTVDVTKPDGTFVTYGLLKAAPGVPICLKLTGSDGPVNVLTYGCHFKMLSPEMPYPIQIGAKWNWHPTAKVIAVKEPEFETYEATVQLGFNAYSLDTAEWEWYPVADVRVKYGPDPDDPTRMKAEISLLKWYGPYHEYGNIFGDLYFGAEPDPARPGLFKPKLVWKDAQNHVGETVSFTTPSWGCFPSITYWLGESYEAALYWWYMNLRRGRVSPYMVKALDDYAIKLSIRGPTFLGTATDYPDNWLTLTSEHGKICDQWFNMPRTVYCSSHWSSLCGPGVGIFFDDDIDSDPITRKVYRGKLACLDYEAWDPAVLPLAIMMMCKYKTLDKTKIYRLYGVDARRAYMPVNTPKEILMDGYASCVFDVQHPPVKELVYRALQGLNPWEPENPDMGNTTIWLLGEALVAFTILGYGFEVEEAKKLADALADWILELQWGVKPGEEGKGRLYVNYHGTWTSFTVNRPDHRGGFYHRYTIIDEKVHWHPRPPRDLGQQIIMSIMGWETPGALGIFTPTSAEGTLVAAAALRIYEAYKWRIS